MEHLGYTYDRRKPLYHGTTKDFAKPKLQGNGVLWLTPNPKVALRYAVPYYHKGDAYLWEIQLKPNARILELGDSSNPVIRKLIDDLNASSQLSKWSYEDWPKEADFGILELKPWIRNYLRSKTDALTVQDTMGTTGISHDSVALLNLRAIESMEKKVVPAGTVPSKETIQDMIDDFRSYDRT
jgi:hypothetical protein